MVRTVPHARVDKKSLYLVAVATLCAIGGVLGVTMIVRSVIRGLAALAGFGS